MANATQERPSKDHLPPSKDPIKRVPVMQGAKLVGIVSRADIAQAMALGQHIALYTPIYDL